ncbi:MAG: methyltransferase type 11 [Thermoplasmatales archaeon Gpl]|nr:MAG: methyltransferase type 11 [Thermoplasmatales archaeon Gpl]
MSRQQDRHFKPRIMLFPLRKYMSGTQHRFLSAYVKSGMSVLDLGSGPGFFTIKMSEQVGSDGNVYAVDGDETAVARLRERANNLGVKNIKSYVSSAANISFVQGESIDALFSNGLLCCMLDHRGAVGEMNRVMKPGAIGFVSVAKVLRNDSLGVSKEEWKEIMRSFNVLETGSSIMMDWAIISKLEVADK